MGRAPRPVGVQTGADPPLPRAPVGGERPLLRLHPAEDEPPVRRTTVRLLERLGYQVLAAANVTEALDIWEREGRTVEAAVVDVSLPEMKGPELVSRLRETHPGLRTLFVSGFSDGEVVERGDIPADAHFLTKPFGPAELAQAVRRALGGEAGADAPRRRPAAE